MKRGCALPAADCTRSMTVMMQRFHSKAAHAASINCGLHLSAAWFIQQPPAALTGLAPGPPARPPACAVCHSPRRPPPLHCSPPAPLSTLCNSTPNNNCHSPFKFWCSTTTASPDKSNHSCHVPALSAHDLQQSRSSMSVQAAQ